MDPCARSRRWLVGAFRRRPDHPTAGRAASLASVSPEGVLSRSGLEQAFDRGENGATAPMVAEACCPGATGRPGRNLSSTSQCRQSSQPASRYLRCPGCLASRSREATTAARLTGSRGVKEIGWGTGRCVRDATFFANTSGGGGPPGRRAGKSREARDTHSIHVVQRLSAISIRRWFPPGHFPAQRSASHSPQPIIPDRGSLPPKPTFPVHP